MKTITEIVEFFNDDKACITTENRPVLTFADLKKQIDWVKNFFKNHQIHKSYTVAIVVKNGAEMATSFLSTACSCCAAPLNPSYTSAEFYFFLNDLKPNAIIVEKYTHTAAKSVAQDMGIKIFELLTNDKDPSGKFYLESNAKHISELAMEDNDINPEDRALILHTSGTTSKPKIVPLTHFNLCTSARNISQTLELIRSDNCMNIMPLFHIHGIVCSLLSTIYSGGSIFTSPGFNAMKFFAWFNEFSPTWYSAVPTMHQAILSRSKGNSRIIKNSKLRFIRSSSAPLSASTMEELEKTFGCPVIESYGMTEASHQMTSNCLPPGKRKTNKVGFAAGPEVAIIGDDKKILKNGNIGEIIIKGNNVTKGYENNSKANKESFFNGWFRTGDQGFFDTKGFLQLTGRLKEIINKGGEKISPLEIDEAIMDHKSIFQGITFPIYHAKLGEDIAAAVVLKDNHNLDEQNLKDFLSKKLASYKIPKKIIFLNELPKGKTGKIQRIGLAKKLGLGI